MCPSAAAIWQTFFVDHFYETFTVARLTTFGPERAGTSRNFLISPGELRNCNFSDIVDHLCKTTRSISDSLSRRKHLFEYTQLYFNDFSLKFQSLNFFTIPVKKAGGQRQHNPVPEQCYALLPRGSLRIDSLWART